MYSAWANLVSESNVGCVVCGVMVGGFSTYHSFLVWLVVFAGVYVCSFVVDLWCVVCRYCVLWGCYKSSCVSGTWWALMSLGVAKCVLPLEGWRHLGWLKKGLGNFS